MVCRAAYLIQIEQIERRGLHQEQTAVLVKALGGSVDVEGPDAARKRWEAELYTEPSMRPRDRTREALEVAMGLREA